MSLILDGTNGLTFNDATTQSSTATNASNISSGTLGKARLPTGSVLQVVNATYATQVLANNATFIDTGLTASITPSNSASKILVLVSQNGLWKSNGNADNCIDLKLFRNSTDLLSPNMAGAMSQTSATTINVTSASTCYLDSPSTTSATTYKTQFCSRNGASQVAVQFASLSNSTITLMEIAA